MTKTKKQAGSGKFRFRKHDNIGVSDAEQDQTFLYECFVDTGDLDALADTENARRIVLGRTGAGKTALLMEFEKQYGEHVIIVPPESLALNYVSNSNILNFVLNLGVNLDIFFRLLWRHVFVVEVLKAHFKVTNEDDSLTLTEKIKQMFRGKEHDAALEYLQTWGKSFWEDTDYRMKEVTSKVESDLQASIGSTVPGAKLNFGGASKISEEEKQEIVPRAQEVINKVQIKELTKIIELLGAVLEKKATHYYVIIDRLDENWITENLRYMLIRALIETVRDFKKAARVKIIIALRYDLIDRVLRETRNSGFQEEKYEGLYLNLSWSKQQLEQILNKRINRLVKQSYTGQSVTHSDLLPHSMMKMSAIDYLIERTLMRPRDIIEFFNFCILQAAETPKISSQMVKQAEGEYSRTRLRSIADEWSVDYPNVITFTALLKNRPPNFPLSLLTCNECGDFCLNLLIGRTAVKDDLFQVAERLVETEIDFKHFKQRVFQIFYRVGLVGLKLESYVSTSWSTDGRRSIAVTEIDEDTKVSIQPCFYRILGTPLRH